MAGKAGRPKKDPYEAVPQSFKDFVNSASDDDVRKKIADTALNNAALMEAKDADEDLRQAKESAKEAGAVYAEGAKANKQSIAYARSLLSARGKPNGESGLEESPDEVGPAEV